MEVTGYTVEEGESSLWTEGAHCRSGAPADRRVITPIAGDRRTSPRLETREEELDTPTSLTPPTRLGRQGDQSFDVQWGQKGTLSLQYGRVLIIV